ncbi:N-acetylmuramoyl-L-alanine amidase [Candidatus Sumerlaeota bacterium]|nr:N-acetylmuramoyl-L-alanine amidase [Candidatus Sumerlaeota bacterium]
MARVICFLLSILTGAAVAQTRVYRFPPEGPQDSRTEAFEVGVVGPADTPQAARNYIEAADWFTLPPANFALPPYHREALEGLRVCLDPGHGGDMDRAGYKRGATGYRESVMNLEVATMLREFLEASGVEVVLTRDGDYETPDDGSLEWRARLADREDCDLFISLHHNWSRRSTANYLSIWYHSRPDDPMAAVDLARWVTLELNDLMRLSEPQHAGLYSSWLMYPPDGLADERRFDTVERQPSGFGVLRNARVPAILIEGSFYSNAWEELRLMDREYLRREAWGIYLGILDYIWTGIPSISLHESQPEVVEGPRPEIRLTLDDGMHEGWARNAPPRIHFDTLRVYIDDERATLRYRPQIAEIFATPREDLAPGEHTLRLRVLNVWGNWSWPTQIPFTVE